MVGPPRRKLSGRVPLERALSKLGLGSRTQAREWILAGKVKVHGSVRTDPLLPITPETAAIEIDGIKANREPWRCILFHKPRFTITSRSDEKGRPTVFSVLQELGSKLHAVGRLDWATSGLLILTNDTRLSSWLTDPVHAIPRNYLVTVRGNMLAEATKRLIEGIEDDGELLKATKCEISKASSKETHLALELREGKNREIRRMCLSVGHEVTRLKRIGYGSLVLGDLKAGNFSHLTQSEIQAAFPEAPVNTIFESGI